MNSKRLFWKIFLPQVLLGIPIIAACCFLTYFFFEKAFIKQTHDRLIEQAKVARQLFFSDLRSEDSLKIKFKISHLISSSSTRYTILNEEGTVLADSYLDPESLENQASENDVYSIIKLKTSSYSDASSLNSEFLTVSIPIEIGTRTFVLRLGDPTEPILSKLNYLIAELFLIGLSGSVLLVFLAFWVARRISGPIEKIAQESRGIRRGRYNRRVSSEEYLSLESAQIIKSINRMASRLDRQGKEIDVKSLEMKAMLESMHEGLIAFDSSLNTLFLNESTYRLLDIPRTVVPKTLLDCVRQRDFIDFAKRTLDSQTPIETELQWPDSVEPRWLFLRSHLFRIPDRKGYAIAILISDVTEIRKLESYRRDFVANVSHELRTPLTSIKGYAETLLQLSLKNQSPEIKTFSETLVKQTDRLNSLVNDILSLSRMESQDLNQLRDKMRMTGVKELIGASVSICRAKATEKKIEILEKEFPDISTFVVSHLIEQALVNLIENAINYCPTGSRIEVECKTTKDWIDIVVADDGPGIESKHHSRIFERFYRVDYGRDRKAGGTGLGLSIVKHIALVHSGAVTVESTPGKGSLFTLRLPRQVPNKFLTESPS